MDALATGYASAWDKQVKVLSGIQAKIQEDTDRACFLLSALTAGIGGGLLGGVASGAVKSMKDEFVKNFVTNAVSDGASQLAGSAVSYFQSHGGGEFQSPGLKPWTYAPTLRKNIELFFSDLYGHVGHIIDYLEAANSPLLDGEQ